MLKNISILLLLTVAASISVSAQTPEPNPPGEGKFFAFSFDGDGGYLGVQTEEVSKENYSKFGLREVRGVAVAKVVEGSPAETAGIIAGDVIVRVNGDEITSSRKLTRLVSEISPDHTAKVTVLRGGSEREVAVTVGKRPMPKFGDGNFEFKMPPNGKFEFPDMPNLDKLPRAPGKPGEPFVWSFNRRQIGAGLTPLTKQLGEYYGVEGGALINSVREDSPAAKAGLRAGDVIVEVDGKAVKGDGDIVKAITEKKEGDVTLTILRDRNRQTIRVTPEEVKGEGMEFFEFKGAPKVPGQPGTPGLFKMTPKAAPGMPGAPQELLRKLMAPGRVI